MKKLPFIFFSLFESKTGFQHSSFTTKAGKSDYPDLPFVFLVALVVSSLLTGCQSSRRIVPVGEVPSAAYVSEQDEVYGHEVFGMLTEQYPISKNDLYFRRSREIVDRLAKAADSHQQTWHVHVLEGDDVVNAAATRGNYVFVWTGLLKKVESEDELASVLAHEVAHVLAGHTKRTPEEEVAEVFAQIGSGITGQLVLQSGGIGIVANLAELITREIVSAAIINPEQQRKELEADQVGLFLMARAKYDPEKAVEFWSRLNKSGETDAPISILSSHPTSENRLKKLEELLPQAREEYFALKNSNPKSPEEWSY